MEEVIRLGGLIFYFGVLLLIGVAAARRTRTLRDYVVADKRLSFWSAAFSARATGESAWLLLGLTGMGAALGAQAFWVVLGEVLGVSFAWLLMARRFKRLTDRYDSLTIPDYLESRFADRTHRLRIVAALATLVFVTVYVSAQIDATGQAFEKFLGWNYFVGALLGFGIVLAYTIGGGFLAAVWSDVFQGVMMVAGLTLLPLIGLWVIGGPGELFARLAAIDPALIAPLGAEGFTPVGVATILSLGLIGLGFMGSPQIFARFIALRDESEVGRGAAVAISWTIAADCGAVLIGMLARVLLGIDGEDALPALVENLLPLALVGGYIAIVLAAIMSTADSLLVLASSALVRDWYQKIRRPDVADETLTGLSRWATFGIALVALSVALTVAVVSPTRTVFWFVIFGWSGIAATFCPLMILSLFWQGMTRRGALAAMLAGFVCVPVFKFAAPLLPGIGPFFGALGELPPAFAISALAAVAVSLADRERVAPVPETAG